MSLLVTFAVLISSCLAPMAVSFLYLWSGGTWMKMRLLGLSLGLLVLLSLFLAAGAGPLLLGGRFFLGSGLFCVFLL